MSGEYTGNEQDLPLTVQVYGEPQDAEWKEAWAISEHTLKTFRDEVESDGADFLLVILVDHLQVVPDPIRVVKRSHGVNAPAHFDVTYPSRRLEDFASTVGIDCINLLPHFRRYAVRNDLEPPYFSFMHDKHWSKLGHRLAAEIVAEYIQGAYLCATGSSGERRSRVIPKW